MCAPCVVLVLVIWVEFYILAYREKAAGVESRGAPLVVLALVIGLDSDVRDKVVGAHGNCPLHFQFVAIAPDEIAVSDVLQLSGWLAELTRRAVS